MSRGLGVLQRRLLAELATRSTWTTAIALTAALGAHPVAVRRALHALRNRGLVHLAHQGLHEERAEVLCAWLPTQQGPRDFPAGTCTLNPKRCVPVTNRRTQHIASEVRL